MNLQTNTEVRQYAKKNKVPFWQIADEIGISELTITRRFRYEFPEEMKAYYMAIIDRIAERRHE